MKASSYEEKVIKILKESKVRFYREKTFSDLKKGLLRFDFYLPSFGGVPIIIEVDGEQHFKPVKRFHKTRGDFLKYKENDRRKNSYCLAQGIRLYRIPYWEIDNLTCPLDLFQSKFRVVSKWHNDYLKPPK